MFNKYYCEYNSNMNQPFFFEIQAKEPAALVAF